MSALAPAETAVGDRRCRRRLLLVLALAALGATSGLRELPLDGHEVLVARSAAEMQARGDWLVPWFNGEPRLNKPPLSYWLAATAAAAVGDLDAIGGEHARFVSVTAMLALLVLVYLMGERIGAPRAGLAGAAMLASSVAFFGASHDARPDALYAMFCAIPILAYLGNNGAREAPRLPLAAWVGIAAAVLTKGPQLPVMLVLALALHLRWEGVPLRALPARLRLLPGVALTAALTLPWWLLVVHRLGPEIIAQSQLAGTLIRPSLTSITDPYYAWRPLLLLLPWLALAPVALADLRRDDDWRSHRRLFLLLWLVPALLLSLGPQKRWFYMLPAVAPAMLWLGLALQGLPASSRRWFWLVHLPLLLAVALVVLASAPASGLPWLAGTCLLGLTLMTAARWRQTPDARREFATIAATALVLAGLGQSRLPWSEDRYNKRELALVLRELRQLDEPVFAVAVNPAVYVYYTGASIPRHQALTAVPGPGLVLLPETLLPTARRERALEEIASIPHGLYGRTVLARLEDPGKG